MKDCSQNHYLQLVNDDVNISQDRESSFYFIEFSGLPVFTFFQVFDKNSVERREVFTKTPEEYVEIFYENVLTKGYKPTMIMVKGDYKCVFVLHKILLENDKLIFKVSVKEFFSDDFQNKVIKGYLENVNFIIDNAKKEHSLQCIKYSMNKFSDQQFNGKILKNIKHAISKMTSRTQIVSFMNNLLRNKDQLYNTNVKKLKKILKQSRLARLLNRPETMCAGSLIISLLTIYSTHPEYKQEFEINLNETVFDLYENMTFVYQMFNSSL